MATLTRDHLYIGGEWVASAGDDGLDVINPATEELIATVPQATRGDVTRVIRAARVAFDEGPWPLMSARERGPILARFADVMERRMEELIELNIREAGINSGARAVGPSRRTAAALPGHGRAGPLHVSVRGGDAPVGWAGDRPGGCGARTHRGGRADLRVQLSSIPEPVQARPRARCRLHLRAEAIALYATGGVDSRRVRRGGGPAARGAQHRDRRC